MDHKQSKFEAKREKRQKDSNNINGSIHMATKYRSINMWYFLWFRSEQSQMWIVERAIHKLRSAGKQRETKMIKY